MNGYELSRFWFDWCFENPEKISPNHSALYFFAIEHCNRLGWKNKFGFPTEMAKDAIGIKSYNTYIKTLNDLVEWGFIIMIERSKNQYSSNIITLSNFDKALDKALDKAFIKHESKQDESTLKSICSIDKQITTKPLNQETKSIFRFYDELKKLGAENDLLNDWSKVRKNKKATNTKTSLDKFISQVYLSGKDINEILKICVEKDWKGFEASWLKNLEEKNSAQKEKSEPIIGRMQQETVQHNFNVLNNINPNDI